MGVTAAGSHFAEILVLVASQSWIMLGYRSCSACSKGFGPLFVFQAAGWGLAVVHGA